MSTLPNSIQCIEEPLTPEYTSGTCVGEELTFNGVLYRCVGVYECAATKRLVTQFSRVCPVDESEDADADVLFTEQPY